MKIVNNFPQKLDKKAPVDSPEFTGSISLERNPDSIVGKNSFAVGNRTTASGTYSHAEGNFTEALGNFSHTEGGSTIASSDYQHVQGKYNVKDAENKYAHIVGGGTSDTDRKNIHTLDWEGNAEFAGKITATAFEGDLSGNSNSTTKWATTRNMNGMSVNGTANRVNYGTCSTAATTAAKTVACTGFDLITGAEITVKFTVTNTASAPTLNVNGTGEKAIYYRGSAISAGYLAANRTYTFRYNGTQYDLVGDINTDTNTDTKVLQGASTTSNYRPLILGLTNSTDATALTTTVTGQTYVADGIYAQPSSGLIHAATFEGTLNGNALTATKATQDSAGQQINTTYIKGLSVNGKVITYTRGDGTTGSITTQDTNTVYTHPSTAGYKHIPSGGSSGQVLKWSSSGTAVWGDVEAGGTSEAGTFRTVWTGNAKSTGNFMIPRTYLDGRGAVLLINGYDTKTIKHDYTAIGQNISAKPSRTMLLGIDTDYLQMGYYYSSTASVSYDSVNGLFNNDTAWVAYHSLDTSTLYVNIVPVQTSTGLSTLYITRVSVLVTK